jgi:hypothetical protein
MRKHSGLAAPEASAAVTTYCPKLGAEICRRVARGESVQAICAAPGMPWPSTLWNWTRVHPEFAAWLREARRAARLAKRVADKLSAMERAARRSARASRVSAYSPEVGEEICARLAEGESLIAISRDPDMPCATTIYKWLERHEDFEAMYLKARLWQADWLFDEAREVALAATPHTVWADRLRFDAIRWQAARLAPRKYCEPVVALSAGLAARREADDRPDQIVIVRFLTGPNGEVLVAPPRNEKEEEAWRRAYGHPYDGPRAQIEAPR